MKVSLHLFPCRSIDSILKLSKFLDENKWFSIYVSDHFMPHYFHSNSTKMIECWTAITAIAANTKNIKIGSLVSPFSFRHPGILANMAGTVDEISKGRIILGVGAGWQENEHTSYGFDLLSNSERIDRFEEGIVCTNGLLKNKKFTYEGKYYSFNNATCEPKSFNSDIPILAGCWSGKNRILDISIKNADILNFIGKPIEFYSKFKNNEQFLSISDKNLLYYPLAIDEKVKNLITKHTNSDRPQLFKVNPLQSYDVQSLSDLRENLKLLNNMNFNEIIIGDMSFINNDEDLFEILNHIKHLIENNS